MKTSFNKLNETLNIITKADNNLSGIKNKYSINKKFDSDIEMARYNLKIAIEKILSLMSISTNDDYKEAENE